MKVSSTIFDDTTMSAIECLRFASRKKYAIFGKTKSTKKEKDEERKLKHLEKAEYETSEKR